MLCETLLPHFSHMLSSWALRAGLFFLGEDEKEVLQSFLERPTHCRNCESVWAETMIPLSGPQRRPSTTKMEHGHQKHLQWQLWLRFRGVTRITTWRPCKNVIYYGSFFSILVFEQRNSIICKSRNGLFLTVWLLGLDNCEPKNVLPQSGRVQFTKVMKNLDQCILNWFPYLMPSMQNAGWMTASGQSFQHITTLMNAKLLQKVSENQFQITLMRHLFSSKQLNKQWSPSVFIK